MILVLFWAWRKPAQPRPASQAPYGRCYKRSPSMAFGSNATRCVRCI